MQKQNICVIKKFPQIIFALLDISFWKLVEYETCVFVFSIKKETSTEGNWPAEYWLFFLILDT